jgi:hypothetical protein
VASDEKLLKVKIVGSDMDNGYNLYHLTKTLTDFHGVLDKAYLTLYKKGKMQEKDREVFVVKLIDIQPGSFMATVGIFFMTTTQLALSFGAPLTPKGLWEIVKQAYDFLVFTLEAKQKGENIRIDGGDGNMVLATRGDGNTINIYHQAFMLAGNATEEYQKLINNISNQKLKQISIGEIESPTVSEPINSVEITENEKLLFQNMKHTEKIPVDVLVQIFRLDGHNYSGRLKVLDTDDPDIEQGKDYNFKLLDSDVDEVKGILESCVTAFMKASKITALKIMELSPTQPKSSMNKFILMSIDNVFQ